MKLTLPQLPGSEIRGIKGLVPLPGWPWWMWVLLAAAVLAIGGVLWWWRRRHRPTAETGPVEPPLSPYERARRALRQLVEDQLMERGMVEQFYTRLSDIVRHYLEGRFHLRAPERTTEEFLYDVAQDNTLTDDHKELLGAFLQEADLVKFARHRPAQSDMQRAFEAAERFVNETESETVTPANPLPNATGRETPPQTATATENRS